MTDSRFDTDTETVTPVDTSPHVFYMTAQVQLVNRGHGWELAEPAVLGRDDESVVCSYGLHTDPRQEPSRAVCDIIKERLRGQPMPHRLNVATAFTTAAHHQQPTLG